MTTTGESDGDRAHAPVHPTPAHAQTTRRVAILAVDGGSLFELSGAIAVFTCAARLAERPESEVVVCSTDTAPLATTAGVDLVAPRSLDDADGADLVVVPTWSEPGERIADEVVDFLTHHHDAGATVVGLCLGAFALAGAGLLDGRRATTHWSLTGLLGALHPEISVEHDRLWVDEGSVVTSAGSAAGVDCCLHLLRKREGAAAANAVARALVVAPQRAGGQAQYVPAAVPDVEATDGFGRALAWALAHLDEPLSVGALAQRAHMSRRSFERRMAAQYGDSPLRWLRRQRVLAARELLEATDLPVAVVARQVGFGSAVTFRTQFGAEVGTSPSRYRATFRLREPAPAMVAAVGR
jgi:transcriptional regulator GlxA family with amidase domain